MHPIDTEGKLLHKTRSLLNTQSVNCHGHTQTEQINPELAQKKNSQRGCRGIEALLKHTGLRLAKTSSAGVEISYE